ncbi:MAG: HNH endonuclease signature motif containing protein [Terrimesophilobacter sp.]
MSNHPTRKQRAARKRKRRMGQVEHDLSDAQWAALTAAWGGCAYCGVEGAALQKDCVQPISRGGRYTLDNVVPACGSCNASKSNFEVTAWMRRRRFDEGAFLVRSYTIQKDLAHTFLVEPTQAANSEREDFETPTIPST